MNTKTHQGYHEALVDVVRLLQGFPLALRLLRHLAASEVDKVDLAMPGADRRIENGDGDT